MGITSPAPSRRPAYRWYVCGLLLLATTINYMDRQTLATAAARVKADLGLTNEQYGELETAFAVAFGCGSLAFGFTADRVGVRWLYPAALLAWSAAGFATGAVQTFAGLLVCRTLLGLFESGHWPCALKTTQRLLPPSERALGNSILQSGSSVGAVVTPLLMAVLLTDEVGSWRPAFQVIGAAGVVWVALWLPAVRGPELAPQVDEGRRPGAAAGPSIRTVVRRIAVLVVVVVSINACWHLFRVWLPLFLQEGRGYSERFALGFTSAYYVATDVGCLTAGWASLALHRRGLSPGAARLWVFTTCAALTTLSVGAAILPAGAPLLGLLLLVGAGSLGLFPCYYALSQEISTRHQGKLTGLLGMTAWLTAAPLHKFFGRFIDQTGSYDLGVALAGCVPLVAAAVWWLFWDRPGDRPAASPAA
jgi:ACS family hexuronate transporter-like MFS transporter